MVSSSTKPGVTVVGHVTHDRYADRIVPGGCAFYGARVYAGLGATVELITSWGGDFSKRDALAPLARVEATVGVRTTAFENVYREDATRLQHLHAQSPALEPAALKGEHTSVLHLAPVLDEIELHTWMPHVRALKRRGKIGRVALSVQGFTRGKSSHGDGYRIDHLSWHPTKELLAGIDVAFLSDEDLTNQDDLLALLCEVIPMVVLTHGSEGAEVMVGNKRVACVGVYPTTAVDPTGAGDTFAAAFMITLAAGGSIESAARTAAAAGSIIVEAEGPLGLSAIAQARGRASAIDVKSW